MNRQNGVMVGDYGVGKTSLLYALLGKPIPENHVPTVIETYCIKLDGLHEHGNPMIELVITDTPGSEDYHQLTQMSLTGKDIVLLCFSIVDLTSLENVTQKVSS